MKIYIHNKSVIDIYSDDWKGENKVADALGTIKNNGHPNLLYGLVWVSYQRGFISCNPYNKELISHLNSLIG